MAALQGFTLEIEQAGDMAAEGFFRRWAERKAESSKADDARTKANAPQGSDKCDAESADERRRESRSLTLEDVKQLTPDSDYSLFVGKSVDSSVRRAALKKLFSDPHFNAMDGLDIYIDDYTRPAPLTAAMLAALTHTQSLRDAATRLEEEQEAASDAETPPAVEQQASSDGQLAAAPPAPCGELQPDGEQAPPPMPPTA